MIEIRANVEQRSTRCSPTTGWPWSGGCTASSTAGARSCSTRAEQRQAELDAGGTLEPMEAPGGLYSRARPAALQDRRVEITGPTTRKMVINALNSGARGFMADFEDSNSPTWANMVGGQANLADAARGSMEHGEGGKRVPARRGPRCPAGAPARAAPARAPPAGERRPGGRRVHGLRAVRTPQRRGAARARRRSLLLPPQAGVGRRGRALARRLPDRRARARARPRHDQGHRADRDGARRPSRWTRSCTSCATTRPGSTPAAGTTSSR